MHVMLVSLAVYDAVLKDQTFIVADELNEVVAEAVAVALDQLITIGDGEGRPVGFLMKIQLENMMIRKQKPNVIDQPS